MTTLRDRRQQLLRVGLTRRIEDVLDGPGLNHLAAMHDHNVVRDVANEREVVRDHQHADAELIAEVGEQVEDLSLGGDVERRDGLVQHQHLRLGCERTGDRRALALPA